QLKIFWRIFMRQISLTDYFCKGLGLCYFKRAWRGVNRKRRHLPLFFIGRHPSGCRGKVSDGIEGCYDIVA
ncbi:hypothetical protein, partial [Neisseria meningitidis]|uniref:hypothetical protein n=1 Tax=Neisseria meningitidis TaxID=487 RepID=UPI001C85BDCD